MKIDTKKFKINIQNQQFQNIFSKSISISRNIMSSFQIQIEINNAFDLFSKSKSRTISRINIKIQEQDSCPSLVSSQLMVMPSAFDAHTLNENLFLMELSFIKQGNVMAQGIFCNLLIK